MKYDILITGINQINFEVTYKVNDILFSKFKQIMKRIAKSIIISYEIYHSYKMVYLVTPKHKQIW